MKKTRYLRAICSVLCVIMVIMCLPLGATATEAAASIESPDDSENMSAGNANTAATDNELQSVGTAPYALGLGEKTFAELQAMTVDLDAIPEFIDPAAALEKMHVNRLALQETNSNTVIYQNKNGSKSTYIFASPVKYIALDGNVRDKSSSIDAVLSTVYAYAMQDNSVKAYFPKDVRNGTVIEYGGYSISMVPKVAAAVAPALGDTDNSVVYPHAFGRNTMLLYTTKLNGVKEDIVLVKNVGENEFEFELNTSGLVPTKIGGEWYLQNGDGESVACLGKVIITDSAGKTVEGDMAVTATAVTGKYNVKITAPESFLNDSETVYPVYIDPTVTISEEGYCTYTDEWGDPVYVDYDAIVDIGLYKSDLDRESQRTDYQYHLLGDATNDEGRVIYRLYDFYGNYGQYKNLTEYQIGKAELHVKIASYGGNTSVTAAPMTEWICDDTTDVITNSVLWASCSTEYESSASITDSAQQEVSVDITTLVRDWARYNLFESQKTASETNPYFNPSYGLVLKGDPDIRTKLYAAEHRGSASDAYVVLDTSDFGGEYYINNLLSNKYLSFFQTNTTEAYIGTQYSTPNEDTEWVLEYIGEGMFYIRAITNPKYYLFADGIQVSLGECPSYTNTYYLWQVYASSMGGVVIRNAGANKVICYGEEGNGAPNGLVLLPYNQDTTSNSWSILSVGEYIILRKIEKVNINWIAVGDSAYVELTLKPLNASLSHSRCFVYTSSDTSVATVDYDGRLTGISNGTTVITVKHKFTNASYSFGLTVGQAIPNGYYYIMSGITGKYVGFSLCTDNFDEPAIQSPIGCTDGNEYGTQWQFTYDGNGYYRIRNGYSGYNLNMNLSSFYGYPDIHQYEDDLTTNRWRVLATENGAYRFTPEAGQSGQTSLCIANRGYLSLGPYTEGNGDYEWYLSNINYRLNIDLRMDQGYWDRYDSFDDAERDIYRIMIDVKKYYAREFFICIDYGDLTIYGSYADTCSNSSPQSACTHGNCEDSTPGETKDYHHKNIKNILTRIDYPNLNVTARLLFTGHDTCSVDEHNNMFVTNGISNKNKGTAVVAPYSTGDYKDPVVIAIHEIGHWYFTKDHYIHGETDNFNDLLQEGAPLYNDKCIYGANKDDMTDIKNAYLCDACYNQIVSNISRFSH